LDDVLALGVMICFEEHERIALADSGAYGQTYDWLKRLEGLALQLGDGHSDYELGARGWGATIQSNLAEASVTTGRYPQALEIARTLPTTVPRQGNEVRSVDINMKFFEFVALLFLGKTTEADAAERELQVLIQSDAVSNWSYRGVRHYVVNSDLEPREKLRLTAALDKLDPQATESQR
jgi:hypothetical protein